MLLVLSLKRKDSEEHPKKNHTNRIPISVWDTDRYYPHGGLMEDLMDSGLRPQLDDICDEEYDDDDNDDESYN